MNKGIAVKNRNLLLELQPADMQSVTNLTIKAYSFIGDFTCTNKAGVWCENWRGVEQLNKRRMLSQLLDAHAPIIVILFFAGLIVSVVYNSLWYLLITVAAGLGLVSVVWISVLYLILYIEKRKYNIILNLALNNYLNSTPKS